MFEFVERSSSASTSEEHKSVLTTVVSQLTVWKTNTQVYCVKNDVTGWTVFDPITQQAHKRIGEGRGGVIKCVSLRVCICVTAVLLSALPAATALCSVQMTSVFREYHCQHVNGLCCGFSSHINTLLCSLTQRRVTARGHTGCDKRIITVCLFLYMFHSYRQ